MLDMLHYHILGPWHFLTLQNSRQRLGDKNLSKFSSDSFPRTKIIRHHKWKTLKTTLWCFVVLQSQGVCLKSMENYWTDLSHRFVPQFFSISCLFPPRLETNRVWKPMHCNVFLTVFHTWCYTFCVWKTVRTTFWRIVVTQSPGDCSIMW